MFAGQYEGDRSLNGFIPGTDFRKISFAGRAKRSVRRAALVSALSHPTIRNSMQTHSEVPRVPGRNRPDSLPTTELVSSGFQVGQLSSGRRSKKFSRRAGFGFGVALTMSGILGMLSCGGKDSVSPQNDPECVIPTVTNFVDSAVARVVISNYSFHPTAITIKAGQTVKWKNCGPEPDSHTVTSDVGTLLDSPFIAPGQTYSKVFDVAATNSYHCIPHSEMNGTVTVQP